MTVQTPPQSILARVRVLKPYFRGTHWAFIAAAIGAAIGGYTEAKVALLLKPLLDNGFHSNTLQLWMVPAVIIGLFAIRGIAGFIVNYALAWASNHGTLRMREAMFARLLDIDPILFTQRSASSLINTTVYEVQAGAGMLVGAAQTLIKDTATVLWLLGSLLYLNWKLTMFIAVLFPAVAYTMKIFGKRMHRLTKEGQNAADQLAYVVEENVLAWRIVRLHAAGPSQEKRFERASRALRSLLMKATVAASALTPVTQMLAACALSAAITFALWQSTAEGGTVGGFVAFVTLMLATITPLKHLSEVAGPISRGLASVERAMDFVHEAPRETSGSHRTERARGDLSLRGVSLTYRDDQGPALKGLDLDVHAGETVALVGPSGAGKSTLINLLPRFLQPTEGTITLDGVPLADWDMNALRKQFALVSQDVILFNDTVAANVSLGAEMDRDRVRSALAGANLLDFVDGLPQGIEHPVGHNGSQLSGGQRQRLAIARAIYKDAPILILDEATSALDSESERLVQDALEHLMLGRTSIVIAHRLSTIQEADRVVVLDQGRVVESGVHAELLAQGGLFARLHALQFKT